MEPISQTAPTTRPPVALAPTARRAQADSAANTSARGPNTPATNTITGGPVQNASPDITTALANAGEAAGRSKTAERDALADELRRLIAFAQELGKAGDPRAKADALQDLARQIAKVARKLAEAERALPASDRRGVPAFAGVPSAASGTSAAASDDKTGTTLEESVPVTETTSTEATPNARAKGAEGIEATSGDETQPPVDSAFIDHDDGPNPDAPRVADALSIATGLRAELAAHEATPTDAARNEGERDVAQARTSAADRRLGTRRLLEEAAGILRGIRDAVKEAEILERFLDPEAAEKRAKEGREILRLENETRGLLAGFPEPMPVGVEGTGLDLSA